ncbi:MAG: UDP-N-acetylglucosamine--N-acetylmuramyl-(pentapeptide) pyrophosphoryl-undecaprenol N-acetylglucosamine transferase [Candidatus Nomurabacteria bacterium]|nr:MAG: UDP-N-acetylglucosamine--N-acetylmuramyl-(pentapeptide) pyrophosphoryl-undecaprenol N-acetylglucosamine transferase [Candidatus Nomurabacteria bacterium]
MRIMFVGGGSGGHFNPLIAIAEVLNNSPKKPDLYYIGPDPYDSEALERLNIRYVKCPAGKLRLYFSVNNFLDPFRTFFGIFVAIWKLFLIYPDVIFSKGGFTSVPVTLAAWFLRIPVVIHESDAVPGRANKLVRNFAEYIAVSYPEAAQFFPKEKTALVGIPVRTSTLTNTADPYTLLNIPSDLPIIYVTGGSLGSERINNVILRVLDELLPKYRVFHQTGARNQDELLVTAKALITDPVLQERYYSVGHISSEMVGAIMSVASVIITRAGSTTLFEIALHGKPSIVIPIPEDISRDQRSNAYAYARSGAATVIEEHNITETLLLNEIGSIMENQEQWNKMSQAASNFAIPNAAEKISDILIKIGDEHGS